MKKLKDITHRWGKWPKTWFGIQYTTLTHYCMPIAAYPKKYAHGFCFAVLCCGYTLTDFPISIRLTSLALWQSNDCPSASKATLMNMDKYFMWIHYERLHNHNKAKHNKTVCIFLGIYCRYRKWTVKQLNVCHMVVHTVFSWPLRKTHNTPHFPWSLLDVTSTNLFV